MTADAELTSTPREQGGAHSYRSFDFQVHASMSRILDAFSEAVEFAAFFDHLDDLVMLETDEQGSALSFYQVKSKTDGHWTPKQLAARGSKGKSPRSIIGKSYYNLRQFGPLTKKAAIISNQMLAATYKSGASTTIDDGEFLLSDLCPDDQQTLLEALALDFPDSLDPAHATVLAYERIPLDPGSFRKTLLGEVADFLDSLGPEYAVAARPFYDALLSEITRCTGTVSKAKSFDELKKQKSLGRADLDALLDRAERRRKTVLEWWPTVEAELIAASWKSLRIMRLRQQCLEYWRANDRGLGVAVQLSDAIKATLETHLTLLDDTILGSMTVLKLAAAYPVPAGEPYGLEAALIVEIVRFAT